jgi:signal peptidase I
VTATKKLVSSSIVELVLIVGAALGVAFAVQAFVVKPYEIPSGSMLPTLHINQRILVDRIGNDFSAPKIGEIIVFHPPKEFADGCVNPHQGESQVGVDSSQACGVAYPTPSSETFVKRVVGLPGDRIAILDGHVIRNGIREQDPYITTCNGAASCNFPQPITIPRGEYYMMGDNRPDSEDSRFWGPVPKAWIIGKAFFTYWPPDRIGFL